MMAMTEPYSYRLRTVAFVIVGAAGAFALGVASARFVGSAPYFAVGVCALPVAVFLALRPDIASVAAVAVLPFGASIAGAGAGVEVGVPDLLLALAFAGLALRLSGDEAARVRLAALRPLLITLGLYAAVAIVVSSPNVTRTTVITLIQRFEVVGVPLMVGAVLLTGATATWALRLFVLSALVIATTAIATHSVQAEFLGIQKNPAGQFVADALLLSFLLVRSWAWRTPLVAYLAVGMYFTYSRGAILGVLVGLAVYILVQAPTPVRSLWRLAVVALIVFGVFSVLPPDTQDRLQGNIETTEFNDKVRSAYIDDAKALIDLHPVTGVGVGNYLAGDPTNLTQTDDPHNVVLLETAEGGYPLIAAFALLQLGSLVVLYVRRRSSPWTAAAIAVEVAIVVHSFVDVYWVRGTPVLGWLLIGLAMRTVGSTQRDGSARGRHRVTVTA